MTSIAATPTSHAPAAPSRARWLDDRERLVSFATGAFVLLVAILTITPWPVGAFQDDAIYTVLGKSLASGEGYRLLNLPGEPNATHYPPGYPLVLAMLWRIWPQFPENITLFKFANAFFLALAATGTFRFARERLGTSVAASGAWALLGTISIVILLISGLVLSEPLFMALLLPTLLVTERAADSGSPRAALLAGLLIGALAMVRTLGAFVLPAALFLFVLRGHWRAAFAVVVGSALFMAPWLWWVGVHEAEIAAPLVGKFGSYGPWLADGYREGGLPFARAVIAKNLADLDRTFVFLALPVQQRLPRLLMAAALIVFLLAGTRRYARNAPVTLTFLAGYTLVVVLWPFEPSRFVLAIWPLLLPLVGFGVSTCWRASLPRALAYPWRVVVGIFGGALVAGFGWYNFNGYRHGWWVSMQRQAGERAKPTVEWTLRNTQPDDVLATEDDILVYLYTGRKAIPTSTFTARERVTPLTHEQDMEVVGEMFALYDPAYFLVGSEQGMRTAQAMAAESPPLLRFLGRTTHVHIYERLGR